MCVCVHIIYYLAFIYSFVVVVVDSVHGLLSDYYYYYYYY